MMPATETAIDDAVILDGIGGVDTAFDDLDGAYDSVVSAIHNCGRMISGDAFDDPIITESIPHLQQGTRLTRLPASKQEARQREQAKRHYRADIKKLKAEREKHYEAGRRERILRAEEVHERSQIAWKEWWSSLPKPDAPTQRTEDRGRGLTPRESKSQELKRASARDFLANYFARHLASHGDGTAQSSDGLPPRAYELARQFMASGLALDGFMRQQRAAGKI